MSCTLATLAACFSLGGVYVDSGISYQDVGVWRWEREDFYSQRGGVIESGTTWRSVDSPQNPYGRLAIGYQIDLQMGQSKFVLSLEGWHSSSIETKHDRGVNGITLGARYFPFARQ